MFDDSFTEDFVEFGRFDFLVASGIDFGGKLKEFGDILAGCTASDKYRCIGQKVKIIL